VERFSVAIVGMGRIGYKYDFESILDTHLSHLKSIEENDHFELVACIDPQIFSLHLPSSIPSHLLYEDIEHLVGNVNPDYFIICTNTSELFKIAEFVINHFNPKVILIEKPVSHELAELERLIQLSSSQGIPIFVNYSRRVDPGFVDCHLEIEIQKHSNFVKGFAYYSKGIFNNGSHIIDLMTWFFGPCVEVRLRSEINTNESDPSIDFEMVFATGVISVISLDGLYYHPFGAELFFSSQLIRINSGFNGIDILVAEASPIFPRDYQINSITRRINTDMMNSQKNVNQEILNFLRSGHCRLPNIEDGAKIIKLIHEIARE